ncbi:MAG: type II and III secretion system protein [Epsilonproteobacteria bacterium]|nr:type II and III secretion system protein [Campylobacterota bacterium]
MKKIWSILALCLALSGGEIVVFENEYQVLELEKRVKKLIVGNKENVNISLLNESSSSITQLKLFGKKSGNTSILIVYADNSYEEFHVFVNQNLGYIQKMINFIEPNLRLSRVGDGSTVISGEFNDPHQKSRILALLKSAGINTETMMDLTDTKEINKMVRTKLYLVEVNNNKAKDLGGVTGLGFFNEYLNLSANADATTGATFSGFLLDNTGSFVAKTGNSVVSTLRFLEQKGVAKILDDTVLITTEENNASFHVGGEVYIPVGLTQTLGALPTIQLEQKEYGLRLTLQTKFMEKPDYMHIDVTIKDSEFDSNHEHDVQLGEYTVVPSFISKNIDTDIVAKSNQVIALGGRLHSEEYEYESKVPLLGDIPWLGEIFTSRQKGFRENDLLFFLVPEIVDANKEINDTEFYKEFKEDSISLHQTILDNNASKSSELIESKPIAIEIPNRDANKSDEIHITQIELEDEQKIPVDMQESSNEVTEDRAQMAEPTPSSADDAMYEVSAQKIFLRDAPQEGKRMNVWGKGHRFKVAKLQEVDGKTWLHISEDCYNECVKVEEELWISQRYTKKL